MLHVLSTPALFLLELTPFCNSRCLGCFNFFSADRLSHSSWLQSPPLSHAQWRLLLDRLAPHAHRFKLSGGEPTLHPDFGAIVAHIRQLGTSLTVFTNGLWPEPDNVLQALASTPNLDGLLVSLHGAQAASHEVFSGVPGSFKETVANIRRAITAGMPVTLSSVLYRANIGELDAIVAFAHSLGAGHVTFNRYLGPPLPELAITSEQLKQAVRTIDAMRARGLPVSFGICIPQCFVHSSSSGCLAGVAFCTVDPWGDLHPCSHSPLTGGSLLSGTLEQAWHSPEMERFRNAIPPACHACAAFSDCHGGCKAMAMELGLPGDPLMSGPLQEIVPPPPICMARNWHPVRCFQVRPEPFGLVLIRGNAVLAVDPQATPLLELLDGTHTLGELEQTVDPGGLALIGELFRRHMIEMKS